MEKIYWNCREHCISQPTCTYYIWKYPNSCTITESENVTIERSGYTSGHRNGFFTSNYIFTFFYQSYYYGIIIDLNI